MSSKRLIIIGQVLKPFGIRGELRIRPFTESLYAFERSSTLFFDQSPHHVIGIRGHKGVVLVSLKGIDTPEKASELVGRLVKTEEENLPAKEEDEFYWFELIGMRVRTKEGDDLGEVVQIIPTGANDVLSVQGGYGEVLLPMIDEVVLEVDTDTGIIVVDPLDGMIPHA
ncbi:MAG: ribosome maturation factor RimM [Desulfomonilaceae bacterium]|nr:ribosome maturation factor RimM [Desulfomonilaceae bacterium]